MSEAPPRQIEPTQRELEALIAYVATGSVAGAAHRMGLGVTTVRNYLANVRSKVGATNTAHAVYLLRDRLP